MKCIEKKNINKYTRKQDENAALLFVVGQAYNWCTIICNQCDWK
jgi:hypothetical protein